MDNNKIKRIQFIVFYLIIGYVFVVLQVFKWNDKLEFNPIELLKTPSGKLMSIALIIVAPFIYFLEKRNR